ncbi:YcfL family protein [Marinobacter pelagius]|uniref:DUF1425 domain-containing protein n=1 Tax=Marinobacter pelagius TaxID=379482 RepID=A0A1I4VAX4_9GAMM|nr:YcfL family protein [Marinobacter pelagius]SFM98318.1 hypothetical protein SAMN04487961_1804 [Marinobacter pelagius]
MKVSLISLFLILALVVGGCATKPETNASVERQELKVDPEILYALTVSELFEDRLPQADGSSLLQVQFAVDVHSNADLAWKVTWFDDTGMTVKGVGEGYRKATLITGQTRYFRATAPHSRVASYQLHLREPQ